MDPLEQGLLTGHAEGVSTDPFEPGNGGSSPEGEPKEAQNQAIGDSVVSRARELIEEYKSFGEFNTGFDSTSGNSNEAQDNWKYTSAIHKSEG